jgi:methylmalonyl-CoA mutase N-terminal domain/subunit
MMQSIIRETANQRLAAVRDGKNLLIGVNKFPNPSPELADYAEVSNYFGMSQLILERELTTEKNG